MPDFSKITDNDSFDFYSRRHVFMTGNQLSDRRRGIFRAVSLTAFAFLLSLLLVSGAAALPSHPNRAEIDRLNGSVCQNGFSFVVAGDSHSSTTVFETILSEAARLGASFGISDGDFTNNGLDDEYEQYVTQISGAGVPWFAVPGNHEYRSPEGHTSQEGIKKFKKIFGPADFYFDFCGYRFIILDVPAFDMLLPGRLAMLEKALKGFEGRSFVFMHYPPAIIPHWQDGIYKSGADKFMNILDANDVPYFFAGHIHVYDHVKIGPTTYVVTGGGGGGPDYGIPANDLNAPDAGAFNHFILVEVKDGLISHRMIKIDPAGGIIE